MLLHFNDHAVRSAGSRLGDPVQARSEPDAAVETVTRGQTHR